MAGVGAGQHVNQCGRVTRRTHQLPHSNSFPMDFPIWLCISRFPYNFPFLHFFHIITLLIILIFNFELQIHSYDIPEDPQTCSTCQSHEIVKCHVPSNCASRFPTSPQRICAGFWFLIYGSPFSRLVKLQLNRSLCQMVGLWEGI
jgi:hypothetical protein